LTATTRCSACGEELGPSQRFCGACGTPVGRRCAACGQENPPAFNFCGACGAKLDQAPAAAVSPPELERRWATVLFADLSGFTALSERTDPEQVRLMVDRCMQLMGEVVDSFGGSVDKIIGDALMAVFGAPVAHEDDPTRAVRAALELQRRAGENAEDFAGLDLRVGINTGEVIFGPVGPEGRRELTVMGDTVNTAARLQTAAPAAGVLVGQETYEASLRDVEYERAQPVKAKGKAEPLPAWIARSAAAAPSERRVSSAPFVGRGHELELLAGAWERASVERQPQLVTVVGAPGIGKTRLGLELSGLVAGQGGRVLRGRSLPYGERTAYWVFAQIVRDACKVFASDAASTARAKVGDRIDDLLSDGRAARVASHLSIMSRLTEDTVEDREELFESARVFVEALAREQPTLLVLEDLHWADKGLLQLVASLAVRLADAPVLMLALARDELLEDEPSWVRLPRNLTLTLDALDGAQASDLVRRLLVSAEDGGSLAPRVERAAGGNPLLIEELAAWLAEGGEAGAGELPTNARTMIAARLDRLPAPERQVLLSASVIGDNFWQGSLEALQAPAPLVELLRSLELRDLIRRMPQSRIEGDQELVFKHGLIREVAYSTLPIAARRERHAAVAAFVEESAGDRHAYATILAHHWREAGETTRAADYLLTAAEQAGRGWAHDEVIGLCNQALELILEDDVERLRRARLRRGVALQERYHAEADFGLGAQSKSAGEMSPPIS